MIDPGLTCRMIDAVISSRTRAGDINSIVGCENGVVADLMTAAYDLLRHGRVPLDDLASAMLR